MLSANISSASIEILKSEVLLNSGNSLKTSALFETTILDYFS